MFIVTHYCGFTFPVYHLNFSLFHKNLLPTGVRTEQDLYVRLIDSMTKQVSLLYININKQSQQQMRYFGIYQITMIY